MIAQIREHQAHHAGTSRLPALQGSERASSAPSLVQPARPAAPGCDPPWTPFKSCVTITTERFGSSAMRLACSAPRDRSGNTMRPWARPRRSRPRHPQAHRRWRRAARSPPDRSPGRLFPCRRGLRFSSTALVCLRDGTTRQARGQRNVLPAFSDGMRLARLEDEAHVVRRVLDSALRPACTICTCPSSGWSPESTPRAPDRQYSSVDFPRSAGAQCPPSRRTRRAN